MTDSGRRSSYVCRSHEPLPGEVLEENCLTPIEAARLQKGRFKYWCSVADHKALGMKGRLRVTRPS